MRQMYNKFILYLRFLCLNNINNKMFVFYSKDKNKNITWKNIR